MDLKVDPKLPHHYIIGVAARTARSSKPGELYMKYGPVYFTNKDVGRVQDAKILSEDKLFQTSPSDAVKIHECGDLVCGLWSLRMSANVNDCTVHHFSSEYELDDDVFVTLVKVANFSKSSKELLNKSIIRG
jgi:hypothetical protein